MNPERQVKAGGCQGLGRGSNGDNCLMGAGGLFLEDENVLELNRVVVTHHECAKCRQSVHFKIVTFYVMRISPQ